jgi:hypothetical protein
LLTTAGHAVTGNQAQVQRRLSATVGEATGRYAALATGETLAAGAAFRDFAWYDDDADCPTCTPTAVCDYLVDYFHRSPREQGDPGCNWEVAAGAAPISEQSEAVSVCTLSAGGALVCRVEPDSSECRVTCTAQLAEGGSLRVELCRSDAANYLFARLSWDGFTLTTQIGEVIGGAEHVVDTAAVSPASATHTVSVCYDGRLLLANIDDAAFGGSTGNVQGGVTDTAATGCALVSEAEPVGLTFFSVSTRDNAAGACTWCTVACTACEDDQLPASVLVSLAFETCPAEPVVLEALWTPTSIYNPSCGEFVAAWDLSACTDPILPGTGAALVRVVYRLTEIFVDIEGFWGTLRYRKTVPLKPACLDDHDLEFYSVGSWSTFLGAGAVSVGPA